MNDPDQKVRAEGKDALTYTTPHPDLIDHCTVSPMPRDHSTHPAHEWQGISIYGSVPKNRGPYAINRAYLVDLHSISEAKCFL